LDVGKCQIKNLLKKFEVSKPQTFNIITKDQSGTVYEKEIQDIDVVLLDEVENETKVNLTSEGKGVYKLDFVIKEVGKYKIRAKIEGEEMNGSGVLISCVPECHNLFSAEGPGLEKGIRENKKTFFKVNKKDLNGDLIPILKDEVITVNSKTKSLLSSKVVSNGFGIYDVLFCPKTCGEHLLTVSVSGKPLKEGPFKVNVKPGANAKKSSLMNIPTDTLVGVESFFQIQAKDKTGRSRRFEDHFNILITNGEDVIQSKVVNEENGLYNVYFTSSKKGKYTIDVKVGEDSITGSPFTVNSLDDSGVDEKQTTVEIKKNFVVGNKSFFTIISKNKNGSLRRCNDKFEISLDGPSKINCEMTKGKI
jgi:hypothetical protein